MTDTRTLTRPDDWHLHLRDGAALAAVLPDTARQFARAIVMPNLKPPVTTTALASAYRERILAARPADSSFEPLMTLYLTDITPPAEIAAECFPSRTAAASPAEIPACSVLAGQVRAGLAAASQVC